MDHEYKLMSEVFRRSPKSSEDVQSLPKLSSLPVLFTSKIRDREEGIVIYSFYTVHGSELTYFWKLCQAKQQQLTFFNQAWEIGLQALAGVRSKFSTRRRESWQVYKRDQGVEFKTSKNKASWWLESGLNMGPQYPSYKSSALTAQLR